MFEIGNTLREARLRRGLDILQCEAETKIRAKYLRAMEDENFDLMPSPTYVRGFLRTYADFLDLDGQLVLDEYESRFGIYELGPADEPEPWRASAGAPPRRRSGSARPRPRPGSAPAGPRGRRPPRRRRTEVRLLWLAIGGVMGIALLVWMGVGSTDPGAAPLPGTGATTTAAAGATAPVIDPDTELQEGVARAPQAQIVLSGTGGIGSWVAVRAGDADGRLVLDRILAPGESHQFRVRNPIHVSAGNPDELAVTINGVEEPLEGATGRWLISGDGAESVD